MITFSFQSSAWNPDYTLFIPQQSQVCIDQEASDKVKVHEVAFDERCPPGQQRYLALFSREPRGAMALIPITSSMQFYPPLSIQWPPDPQLSKNQIWHFTCIRKFQKKILDQVVDLKSYKGEITADSQISCEEAHQQALDYCINEYKGNALLEDCLMAW
ncbi:MAG: hypothetical protein H7A32_02715 [Deltaproteobacteria bacterium]|nr:hypothetical protein [Deltaproteobacteria bacterium]